MEQTTGNISQRSGGRLGTIKKTILIAILTVLAGLAYTALPAADASANIAEPAIDAEKYQISEPATQAMLDYALNLRSASVYTAYARRGITEKGNTEIKSSKADLGHSAGDRKAATDLANAIDALRQLPCSELNVAGLAGKSFTPGVYCLDAANLNGEMVIDGLGSSAGTFIFRIAGTLTVAKGSAVRIENGAQSGNVFFVASDAEIGDDVVFRANLYANGDVRVGRSEIAEKVLAAGKIELENSSVLGGSAGSMRICVEQPLPVTAANNLANRIFHFVVTGAAGVGSAANPVRVATGLCSKAFAVAAGPQTVTELNSGTFVTPADGNFQGNFELVDVSNTTPSSPSSLSTVNLATRSASVNVTAGNVQDLISLRFTNRRAITGIVEICKRRATGPGISNPSDGTVLGGGDADVQGFFRYTISGVYSDRQQNPNVQTLQIFTIPAGQCTGPIAVTKGDPAPFDTGVQTTLVSVSELPRNGAYLESIEVIPPTRRTSADVLGTIIGVDSSGAASLLPAPGGGYVNTMIMEGSEADESLVIFTNRSDPSRLKVCKIGGPGIPFNTLFRFTVIGTGPLDASHPQSSQYGQVMRTVDVRAGDPVQGGACQFVPGFGASAPDYDQFQTFTNGLPVTIVENGLSPDNPEPQNPGQLRTSQIRTFGSAFVSTGVAGFSPNPDVNAVVDRVSRAAIVARASIVEVEFTGFRFNPTVLKVCKIGIGAAAGRPFNFTVALVSPQIGGANPGNMFPAFTQNISVVAAPEPPPGVPSYEGNCAFVNGSSLLGGAFNQGSTVTVTETGGSDIILYSIMSLSAGSNGLAVDLVNRRATFSGPNGLMAGVNSVTFANRIGVVCRPVDHSVDNSVAYESLRPFCTPRATRFDFDGDRKSDPALFRPSTGAWTILRSASGGSISSGVFGISGDKPVAADYDGDGKTDLAVWRPSNGRWYVQGSTGTYTYTQWGQDGDFPQMGDYDGDGKDDLIIFRPSNATWYIRTTSDRIVIFQFGNSTDKPFAADYDGDGRTDAGVFRNGTWYTQQSTRGFRITQFGQANDIPVVGDYDGDGASDFAVFRAGTWYILTATTYNVKVLGEATDIPAPADYDGDGKFDLAVYRPSEDKWYIRRSALGEASSFITINMGVAGGDIPVQSPYWLLP